MEDEREIVTVSISDQELGRRWKEVRKRMEQEKIDFLVMQNDNEWLGGYVKWFTDVPARNASPHTIIFPVDEEMTTITEGGKPPGDMGPPVWTLRGMKRRLTAPFLRSAAYTNTYDAELAVEVLKVRKKATIGILGKGTLSAAFFEHLLRIVKVLHGCNSKDKIEIFRCEGQLGGIGDRETYAGCPAANLQQMLFGGVDGGKIEIYSGDGLMVALQDAGYQPAIPAA